MGLSMQTLKLDNIQLGDLMEQGNTYLSKVCQDVIDRPRLESPRELTIKVKITPKVDPESGINVPDIDWEVGFKVPGSKGMTTRAFVEDGELKINTMDPVGRRPQDPTLFDSVADVREVRNVQ